MLTIDSLLDQEVNLFLLHAYGLNGTCLEKLSSSDAYYIIEDYPVFSLFPEKCLLSIEDDYSQALASILTAEDFNPSSPPRGIARVRKGVLIGDKE